MFTRLYALFAYLGVMTIPASFWDDFPMQIEEVI